MIILSCKDDPYDRYEGVWEGTFDGTEEGTWRFLIESDGDIKGGAIPEGFDGNSFIINGFITEDGEVSLEANVLNRKLEYQAYASETELSGTWISEDGSNEGTWEGSKRPTEDGFPYNLIFNP